MGGGFQSSLSKTQQSAESSSNTINITSALPIRKQLSQGQFDMMDYESCYRVRMNPNMFVQKIGFFENFDVNKTSFYPFLDPTGN